MKNHSRPPEVKMTAILVGLVICSYGCSSSYTVGSEGKPNYEFSYQEMNEELNGRHVTIELKDGVEISAEEVTISNDSVLWVNPSTAERSSLVTRRINRIFFKNHLVGGAEGLGIVSPLVFLGSWGLGGFSREGIGGSEGWELPAALGAIGGGIGMIAGTIIGHSYNYEFLATALGESSQNGK